MSEAEVQGTEKAEGIEFAAMEEPGVEPGAQQTAQEALVSYQN